jgi:hypothetical protein
LLQAAAPVAWLEAAQAARRGATLAGLPAAAWAGLPADAAAAAAQLGAAAARAAGQNLGGQKSRRTQNPRSSCVHPSFARLATRTRRPAKARPPTIDEPAGKGEFIAAAHSGAALSPSAGRWQKASAKPP